MTVIISKVTNAINMKQSPLITQLPPGPSSARFNLHKHILDKQSARHHTALNCDTQCRNQPIYRLTDWTLDATGGRGRSNRHADGAKATKTSSIVSQMYLYLYQEASPEGNYDEPGCLLHLYHANTSQ